MHKKFSGYSMYKRRSGLKNVKVAIEASANYSYIVDLVRQRIFLVKQRTKIKNKNTW